MHAFHIVQLNSDTVIFQLAYPVTLYDFYRLTLWNFPDATVYHVQMLHRPVCDMKQPFDGVMNGGRFRNLETS